jgi:hypothetical protein
MNQAQIQKVVEILISARMDQQVKLRFGLRKRDAMAVALRAGGTFDDSNYRYKWLKETRDKLIELVQAEGKQFDKDHPHDAVSLQDYIDALNSGILLIRARQAE